ncbi:hypothetical protein Hamer_G018231 [Homarus americanus]|uniref:Uncharacterized protein n=1 Tax=Homarus americanus TaxID=6706 RepID=A0A8J5JF84_HOMAM|nr:hypothetical protein Hamer_G018231 [Homarus americanus]
MDGSISSQLSQYFDQLLGDASVNCQTNSSKRTEIKRNTKEKNVGDGRVEIEYQEPLIPSEKKMKEDAMGGISGRNRKIQTNILALVEAPDITLVKKLPKGRENQRNNNGTKKIERTHNTRKAQKKRKEDREQTNTVAEKRATDDGFKIVSEIPDDDSDISDAFEYNSEEGEGNTDINYNQDSQKGKRDDVHTNSSKTKTTEDGFKVVTEIPSDDSDVSDAFDDEDFEDTNQDLVVKGTHFNGQKSFDGNILFEKWKQTPKETNKCCKKVKYKKGASITLAEAARRNQPKEDLVILDYAKKRGTNKRKKVEPKEEEEEDNNTIDQVNQLPSQKVLDEKELKRVRYDVFKLGMSGFNKEKIQDTRLALAIKLGAKPPKNKAINYKDLLKMKKEEKQKMLEEEAMTGRTGQKIMKPTKKKSRDTNSDRGFTPQVGTFKNGVQVLSKKDLAKINAS